MANEYLPRNEAARVLWLKNFDAELTARAAAFDIAAEEATAVHTKVQGIDTACTNHQAAKEAARMAKEAKDTKMEAGIETVRALVRRLQAHPAMTNEIRAAFRITVPDESPSYPATPTASAPVLKVDIGQRLRHGLTIRDAQNLESRALPAWAKGCEVWVKIGGEAPAGISQCSLQAISSRSGYTMSFADSDGGKTAHYILRFVGKNGAPGPISQTISATIAA